MISSLRRNWSCRLAPWYPYTIACAIAPPRKGSSPEPSLTRPQRGSRLMSTIGLNVQEMPSALASMAAIRADFSMAAISQVQDSPNGMGKMVSYPCITSMPNNRGIPRRDFSTASFCTSRMRSTPFRLKSPPTNPFSIFAATSLLLACPVVMSPVTGRFNCPIFSSTVIFFISASMKRSMSWGDFCACTVDMPIRAPINNRLVLLNIAFIYFYILR